MMLRVFEHVKVEMGKVVPVPDQNFFHWDPHPTFVSEETGTKT